MVLKFKTTSFLRAGASIFEKYYSKNVSRHLPGNQTIQFET